MIKSRIKLAKFGQIGTICIALSSLVACNEINNEAVGTITGGAVGGLLGSQVGGGTGQVVAAVGGAVLGAVLGNSIGHKMDDVDQMKLKQSLEKNKTGQTTTWTNPDEGVTYAVTPKKTIMSSNGQPCREYSFDAIVGGKKKQVYGTACRDAAGDWKVVS